MEKVVEWIGTIGKVAVAIGAAIGAAIGVITLIWKNHSDRVRDRQYHMTQNFASNCNPNMYGGGWAY